MLDTFYGRKFSEADEEEVVVAPVVAKAEKKSKK